MSRFDGLGSGQVEYSRERPIIHFGSNPVMAQEQQRLDRLRASGFLLSTEAKD